MGKAKYDRGLTDQEIMQIEHTEIIDAADQDRVWYSGEEWRFPTPEDRDAAINAGYLVKVDSNKYFGFAKDVRQDDQLQYLRHEARALLLYVMKELDSRMHFTDRGIKLIVNSLHRCDNLQTELAVGNGWYRVAPVGTSSHAAGAAFDINVQTHYVEMTNGDLVGTWRDEAKEMYDPLTIETLSQILSELEDIGICNFIIENQVIDNDYIPTCLHVCVSPDAYLFLSPEG